MAKAKQESLEAKAYINAQINEIREKIKNASDDVTRQKLIENLNELTSSKEYQQYLKVVLEDTDDIRKEAREKKGGDITPEEFEAAKTEFYGKNMSLEFGENFENLDFGKKIDYIFEKFGDTDYAANSIIKLLQTLKPEKDNMGGRLYAKNIMNTLTGGTENNNCDIRSIFEYLSERFGKGIITAKVYFHIAEHVNYGGGYSRWLENILFGYENMSEETLKAILTTEKMKTYILKYSSSATKRIEFLVRGCKDGSISDSGLINLLKDIIELRDDDMIKLSPEGQKYIIEYKMKKYKGDFWEHIYELPMETLKFLEGEALFDYIMDLMLKNLDDKDLDFFCEGGRDLISGRINNHFLSKVPEKHKKICDLFIKAGKIDIVKKYINHFTGLTDEEKAEILGK